jgi:hypothetical protein
MKFGKRNGYATYTTKRGEGSFTHRRVMQKKLGGKLQEGMVVHHVNEKKWDNRPQNLVAVRRDIHARLHLLSKEGRSVCFRCGQEGHGAGGCFARRDWKGRPLK